MINEKYRYRSVKVEPNNGECLMLKHQRKQEKMSIRWVWAKKNKKFNYLHTHPSPHSFMMFFETKSPVSVFHRFDSIWYFCFCRTLIFVLILSVVSKPFPLFFSIFIFFFQFCLCMKAAIIAIEHFSYSPKRKITFFFIYFSDNLTHFIIFHCSHVLAASIFSFKQNKKKKLTKKAIHIINRIGFIKHISKTMFVFLFCLFVSFLISYCRYFLIWCVRFVHGKQRIRRRQADEQKINANDGGLSVHFYR